MIFAVSVCLAWSPVPVVAGWCSPDFRVREAASAAAGRFGLGLGWAETLPGPEVRVRSERARRAALNLALRRLAPYPCADACWYDTTRKAYWSDSAISGWDMLGLKQRLEAIGRDSHPHRNYQEATRQWVSDRLWDGTPEADLARLLDEMRRRDRVWYKTMGSPVPWEK